MLTQTQKHRVIGQIMKNHKIGRNECLRSYITRLAAIIYDLRKAGWIFTEKEVGGDYFYIVDTTCAPYMKIKDKEDR